MLNFCEDPVWPRIDKNWRISYIHSMSTLNVSMPDAMRDYVEAQAEKGQYSASEFVRHLIREDQKRREQEERQLLTEYLAISARQLDEGMFSGVTVEELLAQGRARRAGEAR